MGIDSVDLRDDVKYQGDNTCGPGFFRTVSVNKFLHLNSMSLNCDIVNFTDLKF